MQQDIWHNTSGTSNILNIYCVLNTIKNMLFKKELQTSNLSGTILFRTSTPDAFFSMVIPNTWNENISLIFVVGKCKFYTKWGQSLSTNRVVQPEIHFCQLIIINRRACLVTTFHGTAYITLSFFFSISFSMLSASYNTRNKR